MSDNEISLNEFEKSLRETLTRWCGDFVQQEQAMIDQNQRPANRTEAEWWQWATLYMEDVFFDEDDGDEDDDEDGDEDDDLAWPPDDLGRD